MVTSGANSKMGLGCFVVLKMRGFLKITNRKRYWELFVITYWPFLITSFYFCSTCHLSVYKQFASVLLRNGRIVQGVVWVNIFSVRFPEAFYCFIVAKKSWELGLNGFTSFSKPPRPLLSWSKQSLSAVSIAFIFRVTQLLFCFFFPLLSSHLLCDDTSTQDWFVFT